MEETEEDALQESNRVASCSERTGISAVAIVPYVLEVLQKSGVDEAC